MNTHRMYKHKYLCRERFRSGYPLDRKHNINSVWADGYWQGIGYWLTLTRKGGELD